METVANNQLLFTRQLSAPVELVWEVWTNPEHLARWWGPNGFTLTTENIEVKPGSSWKFMMHGPDGTDYPNKIDYVEIEKFKRIVYQHAGDEDTEDISFKVIVTFKELDPETTELSMLMEFESEDELQRVAEKYGAIEGAEQTLNRLEELLAKLI